jgi:hypothetical protein
MATRGYRMVRYADDFVVLCERREEAEAALAAISRWVAENGLSLHPDKTHVGDCRQPGDGFEFLGYRFEAGQRWVRKKSLARLKDGIRERTMRTRGDSLARIVSDLNPRLRGWFGYFKHAHRHIFADVDASCGGGCGRYCASRKSGPASADATLTICAGPRPSSRRLGCSPSRRPGMRRATPDEETTNWRAVCGRTACTVRRAGKVRALSDPYQQHLELSIPACLTSRQTRGDVFGILTDARPTPAHGGFRQIPWRTFPEIWPSVVPDSSVTFCPPCVRREAALLTDTALYATNARQKAHKAALG